MKKRIKKAVITFIFSLIIIFILELTNHFDSLTWLFAEILGVVYSCWMMIDE